VWKPEHDLATDQPDIKNQNAKIKMTMKKAKMEEMLPICYELRNAGFGEARCTIEDVRI
jgi:hypothetical protein